MTPVSVDQQFAGVESVMARHTVARAIYVAPILIFIFALISGWQGAWSSTLGVAVVVANFLLAGELLVSAHGGLLPFSWSSATSS